MPRPGVREPFLFYGFLLFVFLIPLSQPLSSALLVILVIAALIPPGRFRLFLTVFKLSWDKWLYLGILVMGLLYSTDRQTGYGAVETSLSLVAMSLVVHRLESFQRQHLRLVFFAFAAGLVLTSLICLVYAASRFSKGGGTEVFFFNELTGVMDMQPTYLAYYLIAAITFGTYLLYEKSRVPVAAVIGVLLFLFGMLLFTGGLTAWVSILYVFSFFLLRFLLDRNVREHLPAFVVVITLVAGMFLFNELRNRDPSGFVMDDGWERLVLWEAALQASPVTMFGVGTGDYQAHLNDYYRTHGMQAFAETNFNAHNQFIGTYVAHGLVGLFVLLLMLIRPLVLAVQSGNALGSLIFFPFLIYGMTEVFLGRYQGVVFFALMSQCFVAYHYGLRPSFTLKPA
jgi:O-antigen ligase